MAVSIILLTKFDELRFRSEIPGIENILMLSKLNESDSLAKFGEVLLCALCKTIVVLFTL